jgi:hypothetical protein
VQFPTRKSVVHLLVSFFPFSFQFFPIFFPSFEWLIIYCLRAMLRQFSREELMSFNRPAPPSIPHSRFIHLRLSGMCLFRLTKRPKKRRHRTDQKQHQPSQTAKLCLLNARSIVNKIEALNELVLDAQPDILAITETWLTPTNIDHELAACFPTEFSAFHQP